MSRGGLGCSELGLSRLTSSSSRTSEASPEGKFHLMHCLPRHLHPVSSSFYGPIGSVTEKKCILVGQCYRDAVPTFCGLFPLCVVFRKPEVPPNIRTQIALHEPPDVSFDVKKNTRHKHPGNTILRSPVARIIFLIEQVCTSNCLNFRS